jgi:hypothetical protein
MSTVSNFLRRAIKPVIGLIVASAMIISCEAVNGPGVDAGNVAALLASRANVGVTYHIRTVQQLMDVNNDTTGDYILDAPLTLTGWEPLCDPDTVGAFTGTFDGQGNTITISSFDQRTIDRGTYLGIFAVSERATFSNLTVDIETGIVSTTAAQYVGGLVAQATGTTFNGITVTGTLDIAATSNSDDTPFSVGLVAGSAARGSVFSNTTIEASLNVLYSSTATNNVNAGGFAGSLTDGKVSGGVVDGEFTVKADMPYYYEPDNGLRVGAVAGYAANTGFDSVTVDVSTAVDAVSQQTPTHVAGVIGRGLNIFVNNSVSNAVITGNGPGYTTAAGGIGGYVQQGTVTNSSASGDVTLGAVWVSTGFDVWQIYAGGLVGYSGGSSTAGSVIEHSHASGNISATAPYPYAGGLVGYNYGYVEFTPDERQSYYRGLLKITASVTSNGSRIVRSYATGNAMATATPGSNGLPYAGGLAGYSSVPTATTTDPDPNIENSYARGNATVTTEGKYGWAGGLLASNAQGSIVDKTYATGDVFVTVGDNDLPYPQPGINPGAAGGGIAGTNYYTDVSSDFDPLVEHSVALNKLIYGAVTTGSTPYLLHRVVGDLGDPAQGYGLGTLDDNLANRYMLVSPVWHQDIGLDKLDGDDTDAKPPTGVFTGLGWNFSDIWTMGADGYPVLQ